MVVIALISTREYKPLNLYLINYPLFAAIWRINYHTRRYKDLKIYGEGEIPPQTIKAVIGGLRTIFSS